MKWTTRAIKLNVEVSNGGPYELVQTYTLESCAEAPNVGDFLCLREVTVEVKTKFVDYHNDLIIVRCK